MNKFNITLLGTGTPRLQADRYGPSSLVEAGDEKFIIDCGRGTLQRVFESGTPITSIGKVLLTHLHSDHTVGFPDVWLTPWAFERKGDFQVWGPAGTEDMMAKLEAAFAFDIETRPLHDGIEAKDAAICAEDIKPGVFYDRMGIKITAFEVDHSPVNPAYGYRVDYEGKSVVFSGDTNYCESLIEHSRDVDILFCNVSGGRENITIHSERDKSIMKLHLMPEDAGRIFDKANVRLAVYIHMVQHSDIIDIIDRTRQTYTGPLKIGNDLMVFEVE